MFWDAKKLEEQRKNAEEQRRAKRVDDQRRDQARKKAAVVAQKRREEIQKRKDSVDYKTMIDRLTGQAIDPKGKVQPLNSGLGYGGAGSGSTGASKVASTTLMDPQGQNFFKALYEEMQSENKAGDTSGNANAGGSTLRRPF